MLRRAVVLLLVCALAAGEFPAHAAGVSVVGVITQASRANIASASVTAGANVYDGDLLTTASDGLLRVRSGAAQFYLLGRSAANVHSASGGTLATLTSGKIVFSSAKAEAMDIEVDQAHRRPTSDQPTVAQVSVLGPKTIEVRAKRGSLLFLYGGETQLVAEGTTYRFILDPSSEDSAAAGAAARFPKNDRPHPPARNPFVCFFIGTAAVVTYFAVDEALESPSKP